MIVLRFPDANTDGASSASSETAAQSDVEVVESSTTETGDKSLDQVVEEAAQASLDSQAKEPAPPATKEEDAEGKEVDKEEPDDKAEAKKSEEEKEKPEEENDESLPFHKHPRFQEVIKERDTVKQELETAKPQAQRARDLETYCQQNGITNQEFQSALEIAAMLHKDPKAARTKLNEYVEQLDVALGDKLPADLQRKVDDGVIDLELAKEHAALRLQARGSEFRVKSEQERYQQMQSQMKMDAVNTWEANKRATDPDFGKKFDMLRDRVSFLLATNPPQTAQQAVQQLEDAYAYVNKMVSSFVPKPSSKKVLTTNGSSVKKEDDFVLNDLDKDLPTLVDRIAAQHSRP